MCAWESFETIVFNLHIVVVVVVVVVVATAAAVAVISLLFLHLCGVSPSGCTGMFQANFCKIIIKVGFQILATNASK